MPSIFKVTKQQKKRIKTLEKINLLTPFFLTYLVKSNNFLYIRVRLIKKIKTTKKVFDIIINKDRNKAKIFLQQVLKSLLKKKKKISSILNTFTAKRKAITLTNDLKNRIQK